MNMEKQARGILALAAGGFLLLGCSVQVAPAPGPGGASPGANAATGSPVKFRLKVPASSFHASAPVQVRIMDAEQLAIAEKTAGCTVSYDAVTKQEKTSCPPGVTPQKPNPEIVSTTAAELEKGLEIASRSVTVGERYSISVSGKASDNCNTASTSAQGTAGEALVSASFGPVAQTELACIPAGEGPPR